METQTYVLLVDVQEESAPDEAIFSPDEVFEEE